MKKRLVMIIALAGAVVTGAVGMSNAATPQCGGASWYSLPGQTTASGKSMNPNALTAAHKTLPFGTKVKVVNKVNGKSIVVTINDRGPFISGRIIDLTPAGAKVLGFKNAGVTSVCLTRI